MILSAIDFLFDFGYFFYNKRPAQAFTPPGEKKVGAKWAFMSNCSGREHEKWLFKNIFKMY